MKQDGMLATLMRKLGGTVEAAAPEAVVALQAEFDAFKATAEAQHTELAAALETALNAVKEADAKVAEMQAALDAVAEEQEKALKAAEEAKASARKQKVEAAVGTEKAPALLTATNELDDAAFDAVVSALSMAVDTESKSKMFTEKGAAAEVDPNAVEEISAEMKILRDKYKSAE